MGPVMPPSKKPEASGVSVASGLSQLYQVSAITRALCDDDELELALPVPAIKLEKSGADDEELTNLNWLHESKNLLTSFGDPVLRSVSPVQEPDDDPPPSPATSDLAYDAKHNPNCKPPYSFSCLIFMAIEDAPSKRLPVKDIYNWILEHFPYFANAPTGWKNSVRHNLSLNKCFKKVDKDRSQVRALSHCFVHTPQPPFRAEWAKRQSPAEALHLTTTLQAFHFHPEGAKKTKLPLAPPPLLFSFLFYPP